MYYIYIYHYKHTYIGTFIAMGTLKSPWRRCRPSLRSEAPEMAAVLPPGSPQRQRQGVLGASPQRWALDGAQKCELCLLVNRTPTYPK